MGDQASVDPIRAAADLLREKKGLSYGTAKLEQVEGEGDYVEYFRGKDLVRYIEANPGKMDAALKERSGRTAEEAAAELIRAFLSRGLVYRTDRKYKRPKPGRTRLVKWPRTLVLVREQQWEPSAFFAWRYDRPTPLWYWAASIAVPVVVILACLFPLAPWWVRVGVVYFLMAILILLLSLISVRYVMFAAVWAATGSSFWLFPNMMSEQVGLLDAFTPVITFQRSKSIFEQWQARVVIGLLLGGVFWMLAAHSPDLAHLKDDVSKAHDAFVEYMDSMHARDKSFLNGTTVNATTTGPKT